MHHGVPPSCKHLIQLRLAWCLMINICFEDSKNNSQESQYRGAKRASSVVGILSLV